MADLTELPLLASNMPLLSMVASFTSSLHCFHCLCWSTSLVNHLHRDPVSIFVLRTQSKKKTNKPSQTNPDAVYNLEVYIKLHLEKPWLIIDGQIIFDPLLQRALPLCQSWRESMGKYSFALDT